jgi:hypothetical protein
MRKQWYISIFLFTLLLSGTKGQDVTVKAGFDSSKIYIGDQIKYTVTIDQPSDILLEFPLLKDTLVKNIEILSGPAIDSAAIENSRLRITRSYLITSFDSGYYEVPPAYAEIKRESGIKRFYSEYSPLEVMRVKIAPADSTAKIFDIIGPYKAPVTLGEILPWVLLLALAAALIWGIIRLFRKFRRQKKEPEVVINPDPAHVIAFRELEKLRDEQLWQKGEVKLYYSRLTEILRQYLENRYGVYSLEMTTSETLEALLRTGFKKDSLYTSLKTILNGSDLVKFAKYKPEPVENDTHFQNAWAFVEATRIRGEQLSLVVPDEINEKKT